MERKEAAVMSDTYRDCLRQYGLKSTKARNLVLAVLSRQQGVITVEDVYTTLLEGGDKVSFSTVYRILEMFTKRDLTEKIFLPDEGKYGFSLRRPGHTHRLICLQCHQIVDLPHCPLHDYEREVEKKTDFDIVSHNLELYGYSPACKKKLPPSER